MYRSIFSLVCILCVVSGAVAAGGMNIFNAVESGSLDNVKRLAQTSPVLLKLKNDAGLTPLNLAASLGHLEILKYLQGLGADLYAGDNEGSNALHNAAVAGHVYVVKYLLDEDMDINGKDSNQVTPLHFACFGGHADVVTLLLDRGAEVNAINIHGATPLHNAAFRNNLDTVRLLLAHHAYPQVMEKINGITPLHWAAMRGNTEMIRAFQDAGFRLDPPDFHGNTPLVWAARRASPDTLKFLLDTGAEVNCVNLQGNTPILEAAFFNNPENIRFLVEHDADLNKQNKWGWTPLNRVVEHESPDAMNILLDAGAEMNLTTQDGITALHRAVCSGRPANAAELVARGADLTIPDVNTGRTVLHSAAIGGYSILVKQLLDAGAEPDARDTRGWTAMDYATRYGHTASVSVLAAAGATAAASEHAPESTLNTRLPEGHAVCTYLNHCGWAVQTRNHFLIFDYWKSGDPPDNPGLVNGWIAPEDLRKKSVIVFVTHEHRDHFDPRIFQWADALDHVTYVFGFQPEQLPQHRDTPYLGPEYVYTAPRTTHTFDGVEITTIQANDAGVGFLVRADDVELFHAGDHAGWQDGEKDAYMAEIDFLASHTRALDLAFLNVTGCHSRNPDRLREGNLYCLDTLSPKYFVPTHAGHQERVYAEWRTEMKTVRPDQKMLCPELPGDRFTVK